MRNCLEEAEKSGYKTIAMPAVGTGNLKYPAVESAKLMKQEIEAFRTKYPSSTLHVNIVILHTQQELNKVNLH